MNKLKKYFIIPLTAILVSFFFSACSGANVPDTPVPDKETNIAENSNISDGNADNENDGNTNTDISEPIESKIDSEVLSKLEKFNVTSKNLNNNVWDDVISNLDKGENHSPELTWDTVEGANCYVIIMVDTDAFNWVHWVSSGISDTSIPEGYSPNSDYVGPYPPKGATHNYEVYVLALKEEPERIKTSMDSADPLFTKNLEALDVNSAGESGNIISYGCIVGQFSH